MHRINIPIGLYDTYVKFHIDFEPEDVEGKISEEEHGVTLMHSNGTCDVFIWQSENLRAVVHETYHCVRHILDSRGVKCDEAGAYLMDYIVSHYRLKLDKILMKVDKNKKKTKMNKAS